MYLKEEKKTIQVRIPVDEYEKLVDLAEYNGITVSKVVRSILSGYLISTFWEGKGINEH